MAARRGRQSNLWKNGRYSGFTEYRYGGAIAVSQRRAKAIHTKAQRESVAQKIADLFREAEPTVFAYEGLARHGLRSLMCLRGIAFADADGEATVIVARAFAILATARPTWTEGQRGYVDPQPLDFSHKEPDYQARWRQTCRDRNTARSCLRCGASFKPVREAGKAQFCSVDCRAKHFGALRAVAQPSRACVCECCGERFLAATTAKKICSKRCHSIMARFRSNTPPAKLSPPVFDYVFKMAA